MGWRVFQLALFSSAVIFLGWIVYEVGWDNLWRQLRQVGWGWPLLLAPYGVATWLEALSWRCLLVRPSPCPSLWWLFLLRLGGEALNTLTPTAGLGGEPFKAARLAAAGLPWEEAAASVVLHKAITFLSLAVYILMGVALAPVLLHLSSALLRWLAVGAGLLVLLSLVVLALSAHSPCLGVLRGLERRGLCPAALKAQAHHLERLDLQLSRFFRRHPGRGLLSLLLFFLAWLLHGVEVFLIFQLLGHPISWPLAFCLDALAMLFTALGFFIPAALGLQDGGTVLLALSFQLGAALGTAFSLLRRLREAFWMGLGLLYSLARARNCVRESP